jgi:hypothetical protein
LTEREGQRGRDREGGTEREGQRGRDREGGTERDGQRGTERETIFLIVFIASGK